MVIVKLTGPPGICEVMLADFIIVMVADGSGVTGVRVKCLRMYSMFIPLGSHSLAPEEPTPSYEYGTTTFPSDGS